MVNKDEYISMNADMTKCLHSHGHICMRR